MNSREALERYYSNLLFGCGGFSNDKEELEALKIIKQDLDRLEKLEEENASLRSENEKLNKQLDVFFDKLDNNTLRAFDLISYDLIDENSKLKKVNDILKENFPIRFLGYNKYGAKPYEIMINGYIMGFDKEPYELLKEELENDTKRND